MKVRYLLAAALTFALLTGCSMAKTGASGQVVSPAVSPTVSAAENSPTAGSAPETAKGTPSAPETAAGTPSAPETAAGTPSAPETAAGTPSAPAGGITSVSEASAGPAATADPDETKQVLNGILDQLDQLDQLYSDLDEVSDSDLTLD